MVGFVIPIAGPIITTMAVPAATETPVGAVNVRAVPLTLAEVTAMPAMVAPVGLREAGITVPAGNVTVSVLPAAKAALEAREKA